MILNNKAKLLERRRTLRNNMTEEELILWSRIKNKALGNYKFRRQHSIGYYIIDFYCNEKKIGIELDGNHHLQPDNLEYDKSRDDYLKEIGVYIVRFSNLEIRNNLNGVISKILNILSDSATNFSKEEGLIHYTSTKLSPPFQGVVSSEV